MDFEKQGGLVPAIIQDYQTLKVLMLGYMSPESLEITKKEGKVTFFSRSKNRLWTKGETSGHFLMVKEVLEDCDKDTLLIKAQPIGPSCHTGADTCFFETNHPKATFLDSLAAVIKDRKMNPGGKSYTSSLFASGTAKVAQKVGEEAVELVIEAMKSEDNLFKGEAADLLFHFLVLLEQKNISLDSVIDVLRERHKPKE